MARKISHRDNFRVVITPRSMTDYGYAIIGHGAIYGDKGGQKRWEADMRDRCEQIAADAKRHCGYAQRADVESDANYACEHCGGDWTERSTDYNGGCCDEDEAANPDLASVDTHPEGEDPLGASFMSGAVGEAETPKGIQP